MITTQELFAIERVLSAQSDRATLEACERATEAGDDLAITTQRLQIAAALAGAPDAFTPLPNE
jgi:hypothetical protein